MGKPLSNVATIFLARAEGLVRAGELVLARLELENNLPTKRELVAPWTQLAWRAGVPERGIQLLRPLVRERRGQATVSERAEYAACLMKLGAQTEAETLLAKLDPNAYDPISLYLVYLRFVRWDYAGALPLLRELENRAEDRYFRQIVRSNLSAALIAEGFLPAADEVVSDLLLQLRGSKEKMLYGRVRELSLQIAILRGEEDKVEDALSDLREQASQCKLDRLFFQKWTAFWNLQKNPHDAEAHAGMARVRRAAHDVGHWETVRHCDAQLASLTHDRALAVNVLVGTPSPYFRDRFLRQFGEPVTLPEVGRRGNANCAQVVAVGQAPTPLLRALLRTLVEDFYRPVRLASLHAALYPDAFYDPHSSPERVHRAIRRMREWFDKKKIALEISESHGNYLLISKKDCAIEFEREALPDRNGLFLKKLATLGEKELSSAQIAKRLKTPVRTVQLALRDAVKQNRVTAVGRGRATRYRLVASLILTLFLSLGCTVKQSAPGKGSLASVGGNGEGISGEDFVARMVCTGANDLYLVVADDGTSVRFTYRRNGNPREVAAFAVTEVSQSVGFRFDANQFDFRLSSDKNLDGAAGVAALVTARIDGELWNESVTCSR